MNELLLYSSILICIIASAAALTRKGILVILLLVYGVMPIRVWTDTSVPIPGFGYLLLDSLLGLYFIFLLLLRIALVRKASIKASGYISFTLAFIAIASISALFVGITGEAAGFKMLIRLIYPVFIYFYIMHEYGSTNEGIKVINKFLTIGICVSIAVFAANILGMSSWRWSAGVDRFSGLGSISDYSYLMSTLLVLSYVKFRTTKNKIFYISLMVIFGIQLLLTVTRGGIFSSIIAMLAIELFGNWKSLSARVAMTLVLVGITVSAIFLYQPLSDRIFARHYADVARPSISLTEEFSASFKKSGRERLWSYVYERINSSYHPIIGYGVGKGEIDITRDAGGVPHNEYIRILYEMGYPGLILFLLMLYQYWKISRRTLRYKSNSVRQIALASIGMIAIYTSGAVVDNMINKYKNMGAPLIILVAFSVIATRQSRKEMLASTQTKSSQL